MNNRPLQNRLSNLLDNRARAEERAPRVTASKPAFLFLSHRRDAPVVAAFRTLAAAARSRGPALVLYHDRGDAHLLPRDVPRVTFSDAELVAFGLPSLEGKLLPGSAHLPVLRFAAQHPEYTHLWVIEYDVRFSGDWSRLFAHFDDSPADLLAGHLRRYQDEPRWYWWELRPPEAVPLERRLRAFLPVYRISAAAVARVIARQREGWRGHFEMLLPTIAQHDGLTLRDFGGVGPFVAPHDRNRFYIDDATGDPFGGLQVGTLRYRPTIRFPWLLRDKLHHPVK